MLGEGVRDVAPAASAATLDTLNVTDTVNSTMNKPNVGEGLPEIPGVGELPGIGTIPRLENIGQGGTERGLNAQEVDTYMAANLKRAGSEVKFLYPVMMQGEWPVLLKIFGKGEGAERYLSVAEVRTLFVELRFPDRIVARLNASRS